MDSYIKEDRGGVRVQAPICDKQTTVELSSDFSLPDYQPEIKRLLGVKATVAPPNHYIGSGNAEFSGTVSYTALYTANDGELYSVSESDEYRFTVPVEMGSDFEWNEGITADCEILPEMTVGRVAAPRKFTIKCRLRPHVRMWGIRALGESITGSENQSIERLHGQSDSARIFVGIGEPMRLGDEILCDDKAGDLRVVCAEGQVFVTEADAASGFVTARGEVAVKLLVAEDGVGSAPKAYLRRIPFVTEIPTDGVTVNCDAAANGVCTALNVTVEENRILYEAELCLRAEAQRNDSISYTRDLYSTTAACHASYATVPLARALKCINGNVSVNTTLSLEEAGIRQGLLVWDLSLTPTVTDLEAENGKYVLSGRCRCMAVLSDGEELSSQEFEVPFRYECDGSAEAVTDWRATADAVSARARTDAERIAVDAELSISLVTRGEQTLTMLREANFGEVFEHAKTGYTVCYPSREDTLWSVAKRYHRSVDAVFAMNQLSDAPRADTPESLSGVRYLLV